MRSPVAILKKTEASNQWNYYQAMTAWQIAIAMAAIPLLTKRTAFEYAVYGLSGVGAVLGVLAWQHI